MARKVHDRLYIGDIGDASEPPSGVDAVVNLSATWTAATTRWHPLQDGRNDPAAFAAAVWTVVREWDRGNAVLVSCQCGISRSAVVCASALRELTGAEWEACMDRVREARPAVNPASGLVDVATDRPRIPPTE
ncbi:MAG: dual specificity protein phosphatase family protein [Haloferacaceae archaeon]